MRAVVAFIRLGRPLFLGGAFLLFALGAAIAAWHEHAIDWQRYVLGQSAVTASLGAVGIAAEGLREGVHRRRRSGLERWLQFTRNIGAQESL